MVRSAAATYAKSGIRINCIAPGLTESPLSERILNNPKSREISEKMHPMGRVGSPQDFSKIINWILLKADWVTGQSISLDGGMSTLKM